jgi:hypothetical protein
MSLTRPIQKYLSHAELIWPDGNVKKNIFIWQIWWEVSMFTSAPALIRAWKARETPPAPLAEEFHNERPRGKSEHAAGKLLLAVWFDAEAPEVVIIFQIISNQIIILETNLDVAFFIFLYILQAFCFKAYKKW